MPNQAAKCHRETSQLLNHKGVGETQTNHSDRQVLYPSCPNLSADKAYQVQTQCRGRQIPHQRWRYRTGYSRMVIDGTMLSTKESCSQDGAQQTTFCFMRRWCCCWWFRPRIQQHQILLSCHYQYIPHHPLMDFL